MPILESKLDTRADVFQHNKADMLETLDQLLAILEAIKMEHRIVAPRDGVLEQLHIAAGEQVDNAQLLATLAEEENA